MFLRLFQLPQRSRCASCATVRVVSRRSRAAMTSLSPSPLGRLASSSSFQPRRLSSSAAPFDSYPAAGPIGPERKPAVLSGDRHRQQADHLQWQHNGANLTDSALLSGSQYASLTLFELQAADAGSYRVLITSSYGSVTSTVAALTVQVPPPAFCGRVPPGLELWSG
jgi:hypothetical protein